MNAKHYLVTTEAQRSSWTQIWNPKEPLPIGRPFQWVLEKTNQGILIRDLTIPIDEIRDHSVQKFHEAPSHRFLEVRLSRENYSLKKAEPLVLKIRPAHFINEPFKVLGFKNLTTRFASKDKTHNLKYTLKQVVFSLTILTTLIWLWPKPKHSVEELIPAQYAKIIFKNLKKETTVPQKSGTQSDASAEIEKKLLKKSREPPSYAPSGLTLSRMP